MIKRYATLLFLSTILVTGAYGQNFRQIGGRQAGLAYTGVALNDVWAYHNNPGMLGFLEESAAGVFYENRFFSKEFQYQGLVYAQPPLKKASSLLVDNIADSINTVRRVQVLAMHWL